MARWAEVKLAAPELAAAVQRSFDAHKHKTMATLRKDGSPRISGTEVDFVGDDMFLGSMLGAMKARDLLHDPRVALHSATVDTDLTLGDAKVSGRAIEVTDPEEFGAFVAAHTAEHPETPPEFHLFRIDIREVSLVRIGDPPDHLVVESWVEGRGTKRVERR
jgi:pyridoxamine 5'-phosphate oxidase-like protein